MFAFRLPSKTSDLASWSLIAAMIFVAALLQRQEPFTLSEGSVYPPTLGLLVLLISAVAARLLKMPRFASASTAFLQMTLFTVLGLVISYNLAAQTGELWDARLAAADRYLGVEWPTVRAMVDVSPLLVWILGLGYHSLIPQMIFVIVALSTLGKHDELRATICAAILAGFITILISGLTPAAGNLFDAGEYQHLWPSIASLHEDVIFGLRSGSLRDIDLGSMMGIVTFPSYHAALAMIFIWSFGEMPRYQVAGRCWAGLTIVSTPIVGGHYAVDVLAGIILAFASIAAATKLVSFGPISRSDLEAARARPAELEGALTEQAP